MDKIIIRDLRVNTLIGTLERERTHRQEVRAELELFLDLRAAGRSDDLMRSVDYSEIARRTREIMAEGRFRLLEALGTAIGDMLLEYPQLDRALVRLAKPRALDFAAAEIEMEFRRRDEDLDEPAFKRRNVAIDDGRRRAPGGRDDG